VDLDLNLIKKNIIKMFLKKWMVEIKQSQFLLSNKLKKKMTHISNRFYKVFQKKSKLKETKNNYKNKYIKINIILRIVYGYLQNKYFRIFK
jgi:hypothetical protein